MQARTCLQGISSKIATEMRYAKRAGGSKLKKSLTFGAFRCYNIGMATHYTELSRELQERIRADREQHVENPYRQRDEDVLRRRTDRDGATLWRPAYVRDIEKILHVPYYNRYADKTQVFSFYRNDDITRRALHVQLVSRISRNIGSLLGLNLDLLEAMALGHDIGHTPFGHAGERYLSALTEEYGGFFFRHNVQSVRVLDKLFARNVSLQTLDGILCHNGEFECGEYRPVGVENFEKFDGEVARCLTEADANDRMIPGTLEGCVVRISDIIAYLGKDRQDAERAKLEGGETFESGKAGGVNAEIINNYIVDIVENSYGRNEIRMTPEYFGELRRMKGENTARIYRNPKVNAVYEEKIRPMFGEIYRKLRRDLVEGREDSVIFRHHISYVEEGRSHYAAGEDYRAETPDRIVADFIASMTDDYFVDLYRYLFPKGKVQIAFKGYFED